MKLSTRSRYGVRAMFDLAQHEGVSPQSIRAIADRQELSEAYLEQLIGPLRESGLVKSVRGAQGGYVLARDSASITVGDIIRALDGEMDLVDCLGNSAGCDRAATCPSRSVWRLLSDRLSQAADTVTLRDMVDDYGRNGPGKE